MRILHLGKYYWPTSGGIEYAQKMMAEFGIHLGHSVSCLVSNAPNSLENRELKSENINGVDVKRMPTYRAILSTPITPGFLSEPIDASDILHIHLPHPLAEIRIFFALAFRQIESKKLFPYLHALPISQGILGKIWFHCITRWILDRSARILVSNANFPNAFPEVQRWKHKISIITFASTKILEESELSKLQKQRFQNKEVLSVGRLVPYKGFDLLIRAWKLARENSTFRDYKLNIVGSGPELDRLRKLISDLDLQDCVHIRSHIPDAERDQLLRNSSIFVAPSRTNAETFGISILEAMAFGLPVITTDIPTGVSILARGGDCGRQVKAGSIPELAEALIELGLDQEMQNRAGIANLHFAKENHSELAVQSEYEKVLGMARQT